MLTTTQVDALMRTTTRELGGWGFGHPSELSDGGQVDPLNGHNRNLSSATAAAIQRTDQPTNQAANSNPAGRGAAGGSKGVGAGAPPHDGIRKGEDDLDWPNRAASPHRGAFGGQEGTMATAQSLPSEHIRWHKKAGASSRSRTMIKSHTGTMSAVGTGFPDASNCCRLIGCLSIYEVYFCWSRSADWLRRVEAKAKLIAGPINIGLEVVQPRKSELRW